MVDVCNHQRTKLNRASFLRLSALSAITLTAAACAPPQSTPTAAPTSAPKATTAPSAGAPTATAAPAAQATTAATPTVAATATSAANIAQSGYGQVPSAKIGTTVQETTYTGELHEAPSLAQLVKAGKLPPVKDRLPEQPYVVDHAWVTQGKYGGWMQWACTDKSDWGTTHYIQESMYGHTLLRWHQDGLAIGPGLITSWEANPDLSSWVFHFRKGVKWSDGQPWTVDDILFWWEDEVGVSDLNMPAPDELKSANKTPAKLEKVDDYTLKITFDTPAPLLLDRMAIWVKRGIGPQWMDPKHYLSQFHIKYNPSLDKGTWVKTFQQKQDWPTNPDNPTLTGWRVTSYTKGKESVWERNPYYWAIDKWGNQLPYIDGITQTNVQDPQVFRLTITEGKVDYVHGGFVPLTLADIPTLKSAQQKTKLNLTFWDSGSGTASMYFFNRNFADPKYRKLFQTPNFLKAMSHAYNRVRAQKQIYFETGDLTTGTMSPKMLEFHVPGGTEIYQQWRDSASKYDANLAKKMLDDLGLKVGSGGWRTFPDGTPLQISVDYPADLASNDEHMQKNELLVADWKAIGINAKLNPIEPTVYSKDPWFSGKQMMQTAWEVGDGPAALVYPQWLVPLENSRWAPMYGQFEDLAGTPLAEKGLNPTDPYKSKPPRQDPKDDPPIAQLEDLYNKAKVETDIQQRTKYVWDIIKVHITDGPFFCGTVANYPRIVLYREGLKNVPTHDDLHLHGFVNPWVHPTPAVYDPEAYFWDNPDQHNAH